MGFSAVLLDWRGTLVTTQSELQWIEDGLLRAGLSDDANQLTDRIRKARGPKDRLDAPGMDADSALHERLFFEVLEDAGVDPALATALYESERDFRRNAWAVDAASTIRTLKAHDVRVGVISDIHFDIRPAFATEGIEVEIDAFALSHEVGAQKPSAEIYNYALKELGATPSETLMVGDRAHSDGGAIDLGISTLLLPPLRGPEDQRLGRVLDLSLADSSHSCLVMR